MYLLLFCVPSGSFIKGKILKDAGKTTKWILVNRNYMHLWCLWMYHHILEKWHTQYHDKEIFMCLFLSKNIYIYILWGIGFIASFPFKIELPCQHVILCHDNDGTNPIMATRDHCHINCGPLWHFISGLVSKIWSSTYDDIVKKSC